MTELNGTDVGCVSVYACYIFFGWSLSKRSLILTFISGCAESPLRQGLFLSGLSGWEHRPPGAGSERRCRRAVGADPAPERRLAAVASGPSCSAHVGSSRFGLRVSCTAGQTLCHRGVRGALPSLSASGLSL